MAWQPNYATAQELAAFKRVGDSDDDVQFGLAVAAASRAVDRHTHRQFGKTDDAEERLYLAEWSWRRRRWVVPIDDVMVAPTTVTNSDDDEITDYTLLPRNAQQKGRPWTHLVINPGSTVYPRGEHGEHWLTIDADPWGWDAVPDAVKEATLLQGSRLDFRRASPAGVAGSPETGSEVRLLARVDPDVAVSLKDYIRWWAAA
jgi:hypothetical protein